MAIEASQSIDEVELSGAALALEPSGALIWPRERMLVVAGLGGDHGTQRWVCRR